MSDWADLKAKELCASELQQKHVAKALREVAEHEYRKGFEAGIIYEQKTRRSVPNQKGWGYSE